MDTSGLMIFALTKKAHRSLSVQFQNGEVHKKYIALLDGIIEGGSGRIELRFRLDPDNRPYQIHDPLQGKTGITLWKSLDVSGGKTRVEFTPLTGRTHQLRLHSAHAEGFGCPIVGDRLYGSSSDEKHSAGVRMLLHASRIEFAHPETGETLIFTNAAPF
jgi:tRNA pseudouridine32 synthase/23S rRNA pseudouridine746 synthase